MRWPTPKVLGRLYTLATFNNSHVNLTTLVYGENITNYSLCPRQLASFFSVFIQRIFKNRNVYSSSSLSRAHSTSSSQIKTSSGDLAVIR